MENIKIAVAGVGPLGEMHVRHIQGIPGAEVVAVCDGLKEVVDGVKERQGVKYAFTDFDEMLRTDEIDCVVLATPIATHKDLIFKAVEKGLHIFCEKPVGKTTEECIEIEKVLNEKHDKIFTVGFMRRFDPSYAEAMKKVKEGAIGEPIFFRGYSLDPFDVVPFHLQRQKEGKAASFYKEMSVHDVDLARWFMGSDFKSAYSLGGAYVYPEFDQYKDVDNGWALVEFENGKVAFFYCGRTAPQCDVESEIVGTEGTLRIGTNPNRTRLRIYKNYSVIDESLTGFLERWEEAFMLEMVNLVRCIREGGKPEITMHDGTMASVGIDMLDDSYQCGSVVFAK